MRYLIFLFALASFGIHPLNAQNALTLDFGQNFTKLLFTDDQGTTETSIQPVFSTSLNLGYAYSLKEGVFFSTKLGFRPAGASYVYDEVNYRWDMNYTELRLGVGYAHDLGSITARFSTAGYAGYLFKAEQRLHHLTRDMLAAESIETWDYGMFFTTGVAYALNDQLSLGIDFNYMLGLNNIEVDEGQTTKNSLIGSNLNLRMNL